MGNVILKDPLWLLALLVFPLIVWLRGRRGISTLVVPFASAWYKPALIPVSRWPATFAGLGLILLVGALARPQRIDDKREVHQQGYDLMLCIDLSGSMGTPDYEKNGERLTRLQAIIPVVQAFISNRPNDRIGIVVFSGHAYTLAPLTFDHAWLTQQTERLKLGLIEDGTAIGDGLGVALTRLDQSGREEGNHRKGAFIILLTDGVNNCGILTPAQSTAIAKGRDIPVYTIGAGTNSLYADLDEDTLHEIADATGGRFYRADSTDTIESAFKAIDRSQKIEFEAQSYLLTTELFPWLAFPGLGLLVLAGLGARPFWRKEALA